MRSFSEFEKKLIKELVGLDHERPNIGDFINDNLLRSQKRIIQINRKDNIFVYYIDKNRIKTALSELFDFFLLFKFLEKSDLVLVHTEVDYEYKDLVEISPGNDGGCQYALVGSMTKREAEKMISSLLQGDGYGDYVGVPMKSDLINDLWRYINSYVYSGSQLQHLVENDFKTHEVIEMRKQSKFALGTLAVAALTLFSSIVLPIIVSMWTVAPQHEQVDSLEKVQQVEAIQEIKD